ncbi:MAG: TCR/Tet family MFS transporter [Verrucomicrobiales bacterium]|nr:TCR/Tet family MFS transporter [Verrucomicrobiales bacterium]
MVSRKPAIVFIFITLVLDILGIGLIVPIFPKLVDQLRGGDPASGAFAYGWILGAYALMQFIFSPILGALSDKYGRRKVILLSLFGAGLDYFLIAWAPTLIWFFIGRIISGITGANISAASAYIADVSPPERRAANFGLIGAAFGFGFAFGPALGGYLAEFGVNHFGENGIRLPFVVAGCLTLVNWLYGFFVLPESLKEENRREFSLKNSNPFNSLINLKRYPLVLGLASTYLILGLGHQVFPAIWVLFTDFKFGWNSREVGNSLAFVGIMAVVVQGGLARRLIPFLGERKAAIIGTLINISGYVAYGLVTAPWMIYVVIFCGAIGGIATPAIQGLVSRAVGDDEQGGVQGSLSSLQSVAGFVGPILMTSIYGFFISEKVPNQIPGAAFFFAAGLAVIGFFLMLASFRKVPLD